jgi:PAS domain S-box-containing protein
LPTEPELLRFIDRSPIGMYRSDARGQLVHVNRALVAMLGYDSVEEVLALNLLESVYVDAEERAPVLEEYRDTGFVEGRRVRWKTRTGRILTVQLFGHVVEGKDGLIFDATVIDLTEIDDLEDQLRRQREIVEQAMRQMPATYWVVDKNLVLVEVGGPVEQLFGYPVHEYVGKRLADAIDRERGQETFARYERALAGEVVVSESQYRDKLLAATVAPYRDSNGEIVGALGTAIDVTAVRIFESRMVETQRAQSLGVLAGGLAHDFNNLLVAVLGNADLALREIATDKPGRCAIENIRIAALRAAELTDQLLAYAGRGGAGTTRVEPAAIVEELLRISAPSLPERVAIHIDIPVRLAVRSDPAQLRQVLLNLITNARDALGDRAGAITVSGELVHVAGEDHDDVVTPPPGNFIALCVSDSGPGMNSETRRKMFEPFFTTKQTGHGLGLAAVLGIIRAHGGGIRVRSTLGAGTEITVFWPAAVTEAIAAASPLIGSRTVLVIDDEALVRDVVARMVEELGYAAMTAADGPSGIDLAERADAVLVDLTMPHMSGADVVAVLRQKRPNLPVVVCSGYDRDSRGPIQADAYLPKPFRIDALERTLAKLLPLRSV